MSSSYDSLTDSSDETNKINKKHKKKKDKFNLKHGLSISINDNENSSEWMIAVRDGSIIENSSISGGREGVYLEDGTIKDSKIHSFRRKALSLYNSSTATGNALTLERDREAKNKDTKRVIRSSIT